MNPSLQRPRVFLSSTIYDFRDLRSALKFWLEELGYEVYASEFNDFEKDLNQNSYEACLSTIRNSDYFILLIGSRAGGWYEETTRTTITMQEYRCAYECAKRGELKLATFVRQAIWDVREDRKELKRILKNEYAKEHDLTLEAITKITHHRSKVLSDADVIFEFLSEVGRNSEMRKATAGQGPLPPANWIHCFDSFRDIVSALRTDFVGSFGLRRVALAESLRVELFENLRQLLYRNPRREVVSPMHRWASTSRKRLTGTSRDDSNIEGKWLFHLGLFGIVAAVTQDLRTDSLQEAILSGEFLRFDTGQDRYAAGPFQALLAQLREEIRRGAFISSTLSLEAIHHFTSCEADQIYQIPNEILAPFFALQDRHINILELVKALLKALDGEEPVVPSLRPRTPFIEQALEIAEETPSNADIRRWLNTEESGQNSS